MADSDTGSSSDESLDFSSPKFNPLKALYSKKVVLPVPSAKQFDNIKIFESSLTKLSQKRGSNSKNAAINKEPKPRFVPNQQPIVNEIKSQSSSQNNRNVLTKMENIQGPLELLFNCMETRKKIKVLTRNAKGIRGYIEAYIAAFDKHWNLALEDCIEVWTRKVKRKAPALGIAAKFEAMDEEDTPKVIVKECNGKTETLERHVPQILLRGEQIAVIIKIN